jgi:hypothetical protein
MDIPEKSGCVCVLRFTAGVFQGQAGADRMQMISLFFGIRLLFFCG